MLNIAVSRSAWHWSPIDHAPWQFAKHSHGYSLEATEIRMLSPRAIRILLRHFDEIDRIVSAKLMRKRPWAEEALTSALCDLLDAETQAEEGLKYTLEMVHDDLGKSDEPIAISLRIDTHQYPKDIERWVTQADLGLIVTYEDQWLPELRTDAWLLQAKRLFPQPSGEYGPSSSFSSFDKDQFKRIERLNRWAGYNFAKFLLYSPRPKELNAQMRGYLNYLRTAALHDQIFDFAAGSELRDDLLSPDSTIAAGIYISEPEHFPHTLAEIHGSVFEGVTPFAWFLLNTITPMRLPGHSSDREETDTHLNEGLQRIVRGDHRVLKQEGLPERFSGDRLPKILPVHTIEIAVKVGTTDGDLAKVQR